MEGPNLQWSVHTRFEKRCLTCLTACLCWFEDSKNSQICPSQLTARSVTFNLWHPKDAIVQVLQLCDQEERHLVCILDSQIDQVGGGCLVWIHQIQKSRSGYRWHGLIDLSLWTTKSVVSTTHLYLLDKPKNKGKGKTLHRPCVGWWTWHNNQKPRQSVWIGRIDGRLENSCWQEDR